MTFSALSVLLFVLTASVAGKSVLAARNYDDYENCRAIVKTWADESLHELEGGTEQERGLLKDLLFFLHVPRTGGRTYFHCFLRNLYHHNQECPRSYDKLRFDPSKTECRLLVTHDDYSILTKLPKVKTSVVTVLRGPVDRVFSTYEFSVEVASRFLIHPNLSSSVRVRRMDGKLSNIVSTLDIWPWRYLVPWMREDLFARREARQIERMAIEKEAENSYDMEAMLMPLHEFIHHPLAHDIVHNGATFQVAGLTNNSYIEGAQEIRQCVVKYSFLGKYVLQVAKRRLDKMLYVGLTENHKESATMFANIVGAQVISQLQKSNNSFSLSSLVTNNRKGSKLTSNGSNSEELMQPQSSIEDQKLNIHPINENAKEEKENFTVAKLMGNYEGCVSTSRLSHTRRRISSLKGVAPANFSTEERSRVPAAVIKEIEKLNSLDVKLYEHALKIYSKQRTAWLQQQTSIPRESSLQVMEDTFYNRASRFLSVSGFLAFIAVVPLVYLIYKLAAKGRTSKLKI